MTAGSMAEVFMVGVNIDTSIKTIMLICKQKLIDGHLFNINEQEWPQSTLY